MKKEKKLKKNVEELRTIEKFEELVEIQRLFLEEIKGLKKRIEILEK